jgi:hypothetical protein
MAKVPAVLVLDGALFVDGHLLDLCYMAFPQDFFFTPPLFLILGLVIARQHLTT